MAGREQQGAAIRSVAALDDAVRGRLFAHIRAAGHPVTREEAAERVGISRKLAAFHLDKLVDVGLLEAGVDEARPRRVGRAPKSYRPTSRALLVCIPQRSYERLAGILLEAAVATDAGEAPEDARLRIAREAGKDLGSSARRTEPGRKGARGGALAGVQTVLDAEGFEPFRPGPGRVRLRNCPFHPLAQQEPAVVCAINHAYVSGIVAGLGASSVQADLVPVPNECCVELSQIGQPQARQPATGPA